jgi:hypothetical protein
VRVVGDSLLSSEELQRAGGEADKSKDREDEGSRGTATTDQRVEEKKKRRKKNNNNDNSNETEEDNSDG